MILSSSSARGRSLLLALTAFVLVAASLPAQAQRTFATRYAATVNGNIVGIGNINMNCASFTGTPGTACANSRTDTGADGGARNNDFTMVNSDVDSDGTTFNSSRATLSLPTGSTVLFAGLYWSGRGGTTAQRSSVRFATPASGYAGITASVVDVINEGYQGFANVTSQVIAGGNGAYAVANVFGNTAGDSWAGWSLVVAYSNPGQPTRNLAVFDGWQRANNINQPVNLTVSGFLTPPVGLVNSTIGVLAWDGDRPGTDGGNGLQFGPTLGTLSPVSNAVNSANNFWNSTISLNGAHVTTGRTPAYTNTLGMDLDFQSPNTPLPNGATSAVVQVRGTSGEVIWIGMVSLATEVYAPNLVSSIAKTVVDDNGGSVGPGDLLTYTISFANSGQDGATNVVVTDPIPAGTTFVPGSLVALTNNTNNGGATNGGATGPMTDANDGDVAAFSAGNVVFRLGINDSAHDGGVGLGNGGMISAGYAGSFEFKVRVNDNVAHGSVVTNTVTVTHNAQTIPGFNATGNASASVTVVNNGANLSITKANGTDPVIAGGTVSYTIVVANGGPAAADNAVVRDDWSSLPGGGLDCSTGTASCAVSGTAGTQCPLPANVTPANLQNGLAIPVLPNGGIVTFTLQCAVTATGSP